MNWRRWICNSKEQHRRLIAAAQSHNVLVAMEVHKRWDPIYADARDRIRQLGDFSFFQSYMSQPNPLFMKYTPDADGFFAGQSGYGYRSIEAFVRAADDIRQGKAAADSFMGKLATAQETLLVTAILEAGRISLDADGAAVKIQYGQSDSDISLRTLP